MSLATKITLRFILPFFTAGLTCGLIVGRETSVDYSKPDTAVKYLALYGKWKRVDSKLGQLALRAGNRNYAYQTGDAKVSIKYISALEIATSPAPTVSLEQDIDKLVALTVAGVPSAGVLATVLQSAPSAGEVMLRREPALLLGVAAVTVGGAALGFSLGHHTKPDYENEVFRKTLQEVDAWSSCDETWRQAYNQAVTKELVRLSARRKLDRQSNELSSVAGGARKILRNQFIIQNMQHLENQKDPYLEKVFAVHPEIRDQVPFDPELGGAGR